MISQKLRQYTAVSEERWHKTVFQFSSCQMRQKMCQKRGDKLQNKGDTPSS